MLLFIISDIVPVGGFCSLHEQCTGSNNSWVCKNGRCACAAGFTLTDLACEKSNVMQNLKNIDVCTCLTLQLYTLNICRNTCIWKGTMLVILRN